MVLVAFFFRFFAINIFWFVVAIFDIVHDVEAIRIWPMLTVIAQTV